MVRKNESIVSPAPGGKLRIRAGNVTGTQSVELNVDRSVPVESLARSVASMMHLPDNVAWAVRDDRSSAYLEDGEAIGTQVDTDAHVTLTPKAHLG